MPSLPFARVVEASARLTATRSRSAKVDVIAEVLIDSADDVETVVGFLSGEPRQGRVGVGYATLAERRIAPAAEPRLTVAEIDVLLEGLAADSGPGSTERRAALIDAVLAMATADEQEFLFRLLVGGVRHGALAGIVLEAVSRGSGVAADLVRRAAMLSGSIGETAVAAFTGGLEAVAAIRMRVMRPLLPMLAGSAPSVTEALVTAGPSMIEWKLDGARVQVHRVGDDVAVFTRNLNDVSGRLPQVIEVVRSLTAESLVLDGEAMSMGPDGSPLPFQETMSRFGADAPAVDAPVVPFFFDVLHLDGDDLIDLPLLERRRRLEAVVPERHLIPGVVTDDPEVADSFLDEAVRLGHEGVMVKAVDSTYQAGRRGNGWIKVKPVHTLDLVVLAVEWGHGRRTGWLSNLHLGARDPETGGFVMLGKTFKGLTDSMLSWQTGRFLELETHRDGHVVYVRPEQVVEVAFDGVQASSTYPGGVTLRFARVRGYRPDKDPADADTIETVRAIARRAPPPPRAR